MTDRNYTPDHGFIQALTEAAEKEQNRARALLKAAVGGDREGFHALGPASRPYANDGADDDSLGYMDELGYLVEGRSPDHDLVLALVRLAARAITFGSGS